MLFFGWASVWAGVGAMRRPLARRWNHVCVSVVGFGVVARVWVMGGLGLVGRGCPQLRLRQVSLSGSCICQRQCGHVQMGVALRVRRGAVGVRGGSCPIGT